MVMGEYRQAGLENIRKSGCRLPCEAIRELVAEVRERRRDISAQGVATIDAIKVLDETGCDICNFSRDQMGAIHVTAAWFPRLEGLAQRVEYTTAIGGQMFLDTNVNLTEFVVSSILRKAEGSAYGIKLQEEKK